MEIILNNILPIIIGALLCLFGYRLKRAAFAVAWFYVGFRLITILLPQIYSLIPQIAGETFWEYLLPICGGLLFALLGFSIEKLCIGGIIFILTFTIILENFGTEPLTLGIAAIIGVILGGLSTSIIKPASIIATSAAGSYALTLFLSPFLNIERPNTLYLFIGITIISALFQFMTTRNMD